MILDIFILLILCFGAYKGAKNGFLIQFFSIFGIFIEFYMAYKFTPKIINKFLLENTSNNYLLSYAGVFILTYLIMTFVIFFVKVMLSKQKKDSLSKFAGGILGVINGMAIVGIILFVFNYSFEIYPDFKKYGKTSKVNVFVLDNLKYYESYFPESIKTKLNFIKNEEKVNSYF